MYNLAIDIGNSNTHVGLFSNKLIHSATFQTHNNTLIKEADTALSKINNRDISSCAISSVVPNAEKFWIQYVEIKFKTLPLIINSSIKLPIKIKVNNSASLGADRICNALYGYEFFKRKQNVIVIDMGTATTFNVVLRNGDFIGGIIAAGLGTSAKSLNIHTGKLPLLNKENLAFPKSVIGNDTKTAIQSGLMNSVLYSIEGIIGAIKKETKRDYKVIISGGLANLFTKKFNFKPVHIENSVLEGLNLIMKYKASSK
ncbi:MAG TPA: type III pantothenate kinase [Ignavibacteria bacterium]|jgi:type III pantothenate kinase